MEQNDGRSVAALQYRCADACQIQPALVDGQMRELIPGAKHDKHTTIEGGGHFIQEDKGPELAAVIVDFISTT